jgi:Fur family ferric uptake transcriptional regulator
MSAAGDTSARRRFLDYLAGKNLRVTAQRRAIIDTVFSTHQHFNAEQLLAWSRRRDGTVSRATVYRTLPLLTESGLVREMDFGKDQKIYDPNYAEHPRHNHIICQDCNQIIEFDDDRLEEMQDQVARRLGFRVTSHRLQLTARCEAFHRTGHCPNREQ